MIFFLFFFFPLSFSFLFLAIVEGVSNSCVARLRRWKGKEKREEEEKKNRCHRFPRRPRKSRGSRERHALLFVRKNIRLATRERAFNATIPLKIRVTDVGWNKKGARQWRAREAMRRSMFIVPPRVGCFFGEKLGE